MKEEILQQLSLIPENNVIELLSFIRKVMESITPLFYVGIDLNEQNNLNTFRNYSQEILTLYGTSNNHEKTDTYWLLYWSVHDTSLTNTFNGYNYLWMCNENEIQYLITEYRHLKQYIECIIKLIKNDNFH